MLNETNKVVYSACFGGFGLSDAAEALYLERTGEEFCSFDTPRHCPALVAVVEELGDAANSNYSRLVVKEIKGNQYRIHEYDGSETVYTPHSKWHWTTIGEE
jgi:hypothetical protein